MLLPTELGRLSDISLLDLGKDIPIEIPMVFLSETVVVSRPELGRR